MNNRYIIQWKSKVNGRSGKGTKFFTREEAEELAAELNREYPEIEHEALGAAPNPLDENRSAHQEMPDPPQQAFPDPQTSQESSQLGNEKIESVNDDEATRALSA